MSCHLAKLRIVTRREPLDEAEPLIDYIQGVSAKVVGQNSWFPIVFPMVSYGFPTKLVTNANKI